jgi:predicted alpha/beta superfamily hydrolase
MKRLLAIFFLVTSIGCYAQFPVVTIPGSQIRKINSAIIAGQEYELQILLPSGYEAGNKKYPAVYLMDSQWDFPLLKSLYGQQYYDGFIPEMIIVGVTWGGNRPNPDSLRARDYTPTNEKRLVQSGGAEKFLSFMKQELFPFVEANYKADAKDRTLMGCSLGGLFTMYALFTQPGLFQRYIAASPAFIWDNEVLYQYEKKYVENTSNPPAKLFMCIGGVERSVPGFEKLTRHLKSRNYKNLQIQSKVLENTGHSGTKGEGYARGLQYVFAKPDVQLTPAVLKKYIGKYQLADSSKIEIKAESNQLALVVSPTNKLVLKAAGNDLFYSTAEFLNIHFINIQDTITGMQIEGYGNTQMADKIK